ncbi:MAG: hypothetical protein JNL67_07555 [Planctomycetaceae bacterium]|nr:hypothetical protein [Planctomycetaceae bacterium]
MRSIIVYFSDSILSQSDGPAYSVPPGLRQALELIKTKFPAVSVGTVLPMLGAAHIRIPESMISSFSGFLKTESIGFCELDEEHSVTGAANSRVTNP